MSRATTAAEVALAGAPLRIGPIGVDPPVVLAPMAGVTNLAFRRLCREHGAGLYVSEMVTARALLESNARTLRMSSFGADEPVRSLQLYGTDPAVVGAAVRRLVDEVGVDHVDLNFGCPAAKVTKKGGGGALPIHRVLFRDIVRAAVGAAGLVPVTVKTRIGIDDDHVSFLDAGRIAEDEGCAAIALHARTVEQLYSGEADWARIAELKASVSSIPVLGNGDIWEAADAQAMMAETGCDGVVVGRGCLGRPWLFRDLADAFAGRPLQAPPSLGEVAAAMARHARLLVDLLGEDQGCRDFRKHVAWYLTGYPVGGARRKAMAMVATLADLDAHLAELDPSEPFPESARRTRRGHTNGPRPVHLPPGWLDRLDDPTPPEGADLLVSGG
ncbi:MAG TPA: tRNA dihydrouridine synthase DusB [Acidimicrobiales bacterium]|nr:tRNA dihydrouridine synthase DusB [Acidimicrobiales bacterium]